jgi:hypothetical protein
VSDAVEIVTGKNGDDAVRHEADDGTNLVGRAVTSVAKPAPPEQPTLALSVKHSVEIIDARSLATWGSSSWKAAWTSLRWGCRPVPQRSGEKSSLPGSYRNSRGANSLKQRRHVSLVLSGCGGTIALEPVPHNTKNR